MITLNLWLMYVQKTTCRAVAGQYVGRVPVLAGRPCALHAHLLKTLGCSIVAAPSNAYDQDYRKHHGIKRSYVLTVLEHKESKSIRRKQNNMVAEFHKPAAFLEHITGSGILVAETPG